MTEQEALKWFEDLPLRGRNVQEAPGSRVSYYMFVTPAMAWLAEAQSALKSGFQPGHALLASWAAIFERAKTHVVSLGLHRIRVTRQ